MVGILKITDKNDSNLVDFASMNPSFSFTGTNPAIILEVPTPKTGTDTAKDNFNAVVVNLCMFAARCQISFTEMVGLGTNPFGLSSKTTTFSKLYFLFSCDPTKKKLYVNTSTEYVWVQILSYRANIGAGQMNIVKHDLDFVIVGESSQ